MDTRDLKRDIDRGFDHLETTVKEYVDEKYERQEDWLREIEKTVDRARNHGEIGDGTKAAIPDEYRHVIERRELAGSKDPVGAAAFDLYWHFAFMQELGKVPGQSTPKPVGHYQRLADDLVRSMGYGAAVVKAYGEGGGGGGGNVIALPVEAMISRLIRDNSVIRPLATAIVMTSLTHQVPTEANGVTAYIVPEATVITSGEGTLSQVALTARKWAGIATISNELFQDQIVGLSDYIFAAMAEGIGRLQDGEAMQGDGTNVTGLSIVSGITTFTSSGTVASGGVVPVFDDLVRLAFAGSEAATRAGASFAMHPGAYRHVVAMRDSVGQPIFQYARVPNSPGQAILGYPVAVCSAISTADSLNTNSTAIYFGDFKRMIYGDRIGMEFMFDPYSLFSSYQTRVRVIQRTRIVTPTGSYFAGLVGMKHIG